VTFAKEEQPAREAGSDEDPAAPPKIALKSESLQIFTCMFPAKGENATELSTLQDWRKFVAAMTDAGVDSRHNTGFAVTFSKESGRIVFHSLILLRRLTIGCC
jgi:hypothetical protein